MENTNKDIIEKNKRIIDRVENATAALDKKDFTFFFFVVDSKNVPNGSMEYIYQMAKALHDKEYKVCMVYQNPDEYSEEELKKLKLQGSVPDENRTFVGVGDWMGEEFANLPHMNISLSEWTVGPYDFLFIPEVFSSIMFNTYQKNMPAKRYVILQKPEYVTEFIPLNMQWSNYGIDHVIANSQVNADWINDMFPYTKDFTHVLPPYIPGYFRKPMEPKKLIVNIVSKNPDDINRVVNPFYWKNPIYKFLYFRDLRNYPRKDFAKYLQEGMVTIWMDEGTTFGYSAVEALRCGNLVIGRAPENIPEWMTADNGIWVENTRDIPEILGKVIGTLLSDELPESLQKGIDDAEKLYSFEEYDKNLQELVDNIIAERKIEFQAIKDMAEEKIKENENK